MSLYVRQQKKYAHSPAKVNEAARAAVAALGGKFLTGATPAIEAKFDKTILGKVLGDRTQIKLSIQPEAEGSSVEIEAFPLNAIGQRLHFGARAGVTETVVSWVFAHLEHRLPKDGA